MKKNYNEPELATYTFLNPDFHTLDNHLKSVQKGDESHGNAELSTDSE